MKTDYLIIAGSSGGHILPAITLINLILSSNKNVTFMTDKVGKNYTNLIKNNNYKLILINDGKFKIIFKQLVSSLKIITSNNKTRIIGFGGFITILPIMLFKLSNLFSKKNEIFIHEQNIIYGLANKINYFFTNYAFVSFPNKQLKTREIYVGNYFKEYRVNSVTKHESKKIKILLLGGSLGSIELNQYLLSYISQISPNLIDNYEFHIQLPKKNREKLQKAYELKSKNLTFFNFITNINYTNFDFIISRSGSGSLFEILYFTSDVLFIPHMHSRDHHQKYNKTFFENQNKLHKKMPEIISPKINENYYFNKYINPFSINKIYSFIAK